MDAWLRARRPVDACQSKVVNPASFHDDIIGADRRLQDKCRGTDGDLESRLISIVVLRDDRDPLRLAVRVVEDDAPQFAVGVCGRGTWL